MSARSAPSSSAAGLPIGEVVALLRPEFSDLTDSKIRFLEDRKLISPARTPAGYRSFGPHDIEVLRWILTRQRDQYLPLSIIGERIDRGEHLADIWGIGVADSGELPEAAAGVLRPAASGEDACGSAGEALLADAVDDDDAVDGADGDDAVERGDRAPDAAGGEAVRSGVAGRDEGGGDAGASSAAEPASDGAGKPSAVAAATGCEPPWPARDSARTYTAAEISAESGLTVDEIAELADFGLLVALDDADAAPSLSSATQPAQPVTAQAGPTQAGPAQAGTTQADGAQAAAALADATQDSLGLEPPEPRYGSGALLVARISREFATYGLQARHLRVIRNAAARDASMFEQGIQPVLHAGGASADLDVQRSLGRLVALCERLRSVVMEEALRRYWQ